MEQIKFSWLKAGHCLHPKKITLKTAAFKTEVYPSFFGVIKHATMGVILYDTGYTEDFFQATSTFPEKLYAMVTPVHCNQGEDCLFKLKEKNINPDDVTAVIISHFHADHICGLRHFKNAKFYFFHSGLQYLQSLNRYRQVSKGFLNSLLPDDIFKRMVKIENCKKNNLPVSMKPFQEGYDLVGNGELIAIPLPGHLEGHTGLYFKTSNEEIFIVGDAVWHSESIRQKIPPHKITNLIISDWKVFLKTMNDLHDLSKTNRELVILPSHCTEHQDTFR